MKLSIILRTEDFRGDHSADVLIGFETIPGETVEQLVKRVHDRKDLVPTDAIEIRRVYEPPQPEATKPLEPDTPLY